ncbi:unnamed protein product, partial [Closterium sp. Naga37s-1]
HKRKAKRGLQSTLASKERRRLRKMGIQPDGEEEGSESEGEGEEEGGEDGEGRGGGDKAKDLKLKHYQIRAQDMLHQHLDKLLEITVAAAEKGVGEGEGAEDAVNEEPKSKETVALDRQNAKDASASEEPKTDGNQAPEESPLKRMKVDPEMSLRVKKLSETAVLPKRGSASAAGYDLSSAHDITVPARGQALVKTDLAVAIPLGTYARVAPRSGLALKHSINVGGGVVDYDYRGNVGVILFNHSDKDFPVKVGDRVAQLILERIVTPDVVEVEELDETTRGAGGFGSTGGSDALKHT